MTCRSASYVLLTPAPFRCPWLGTLSMPLITCNRPTVGTFPERLFHTRDSRWYAPLSTTSLHDKVVTLPFLSICARTEWRSSLLAESDPKGALEPGE